MTAPSAPRAGGGRTVVLVVAVLLAIAGVVALTGPGDDGKPYHLDDASAVGYKGLRLVVEGLGGQVRRIAGGDVSAGSVGRDPIVLVPVPDGASRVQVADWFAYVRAGGTLVLGSPGPGIGARSAPDATLGGFDILSEPRGACTIATLDDLGPIDPADAVPLTVPLGASSCFGNLDAAYVVQRSVGSGRIVTLASPDLFANLALRPHDQEVDDPKGPMLDNVVLAQRLLDPTGTGSVAVVTSGLDATNVSGQDRSLTSLLRPGVKVGLWELLVAFGFFAWWRARRHGRVVVESQPVTIAGSELVAAVGNLMMRRKDPARAAAVIRLDTLRALCERLGVPRSVDPSQLAAMVAQRTGRDPAAVLGALATVDVRSDADLLAVSHQLESIRQEMLHGRHPTPAATGRGSDDTGA